MSEFQKFMKDPEEEYRMIVYGDAVRRADVWKNKGIKNRTICEGILKASLEWVYREDDLREWRWFFRHVIEEAENHKNRIENILLKDKDISDE